MHAYLVISQNKDYSAQINEISTRLKAKILELPLSKIEDVRNINNLIRLSFDVPTLIVCQNIHEAGEEALNAFLKNLEEPQENIYFVLTASSGRKILPTIVSRCQIIRVKPVKAGPSMNEEIEQFFKMGVGARLFYIDKIKDRKLAIEFADNMVNYMHRSLHEKDVKYNINVDNIRLALKTLTGLKANGNVNLQLSNFVINYDY